MANPKVFISYSRKDRKYVERFAKALVEKDLDIWFDIDLISGHDWDDALEEKIRSSKHMVVILSKASVASDNVKNEIRFAMDLGKQIHPIYIEECSIPLSMRRMHYIDFTTLGFKEGVLQVVQDIFNQGETSRVINGNDARTKARKKNVLKRIGLGAVGLLLLIVLYIQFGPKESKDPVDDHPVDKESAWYRVDTLSNFQDYIEYLYRYDDTEGKKSEAMSRVKKYLASEGAVSLDWNNFNDYFKNEFFIRPRDTVYATDHSGKSFVKPEKGDMLVAQKQIKIMDPQTMGEKGGFYIQPGDIIQFNEIINENNGQLFFSYFYSNVDTSQATNSKIEIIGNHVYWNNAQDIVYNYDVMTSLAYFNYEIDPSTGGMLTNHDWETAEIPGIAKRNGKDVYLTVKLSGENDVSKFLNSALAMDASIGRIIENLKKRDADGILVDFGTLESRVQQEMASYLKRLSQALRQANSKYKCHIVLPFIDNKRGYDVRDMGPYIDYFIVGVPDINREEHLGEPVLSFDQLQKSINFYANSMIPIDKLMITIPYYGIKWEVITDSTQGNTYRFDRYLNYSKIRENYPVENAIYDEDKGVMYLDIKDDSNKRYRIWYDNKQSLARTYDFILENRLAGISVWALGFDGKYNDLENVLLYKLIDRK